MKATNKEKLLGDLESPSVATKVGGKHDDKLSGFKNYAKRFFDFEPSKAQLEVVKHVLKGDKIIMFSGRSMGKSYFNKVAKSYIDHILGNDLLVSNPETTTKATSNVPKSKSIRR
jgi:hypothetical protein